MLLIKSFFKVTICTNTSHTQLIASPRSISQWKWSQPTHHLSDMVSVSLEPSLFMVSTYPLLCVSLSGCLSFWSFHMPEMERAIHEIKQLHVQVCSRRGLAGLMPHEHAAPSEVSRQGCIYLSWVEGKLTNPNSYTLIPPPPNNCLQK